MACWNFTELVWRVQDGFAGVTEVVGNQTTWHRDINLKPRGQQEVDAGIMSFSDANHLREDGLDGSYYEDWERLADSTGTSWGFRLKGEPFCRFHARAHSAYSARLNPSRRYFHIPKKPSTLSQT